MVVNVPKSEDDLLGSLEDYKSVFITACGGCPVGCDSGGMRRVGELAGLLSQNG